jgi:GTP-binding protein HflX
MHVCEKKHARQAEDSLRELQELARTAGVEVADSITQVRERIDPKFVMGRGKLDDVVIRAMQLDAEVLIFDRELGPAQAAAIALHTTSRCWTARSSSWTSSRSARRAMTASCRWSWRR